MGWPCGEVAQTQFFSNSSSSKKELFESLKNCNKGSRPEFQSWKLLTLFHLYIIVIIIFKVKMRFQNVTFNLMKLKASRTTKPAKADFPMFRGVLNYFLVFTCRQDQIAEMSFSSCSLSMENVQNNITKSETLPSLTTSFKQRTQL